MKKLITSLTTLALILSCSVSAFAMEVPTETIVQNLNGSQQVIKTYTIAPGVDPQTLIEEPFVLEGYLYTFADIVKADNHVEDSKNHTETVTVETTKKDLDVILEQLAPTLAYDDGAYAGTLALDHTSLRTEASGYTQKSYTVKDTKTIGPLDRNDMSYIPATTVKDGTTLKLSNVEWQVIGTDLVGEVLAPSSYQAIASYSTKAWYNAATGYVTTAEYVGEVTKSGIESVTYTLTYLGERYVPSAAGHGGDMLAAGGSLIIGIWPYALGGIGLTAAAVLGVLLWRSRKQVRQLQEQEYENEIEDEEETSQ